MQTADIVKTEKKPKSTVRNQLLALPVDSDECLKVSALRIGTIYTMCNKLKKEGYGFKTQRDGDSILVWRTA